MSQKKPVKVYRFICDGLGDGAISLDRHCMNIRCERRNGKFAASQLGLQEAAAKCDYGGAAKVAAKHEIDEAVALREELVAETDRKMLK